MSNEAAIRVELDTDPKSIGYSGMTDRAAADAMNDPANDTSEVDTLPSADVFEAADLTELNALSATDKDTFFGMLSMGEISVKGPNTRAVFLDLFGPGTTTRANFAALQTEPISRSIILGFGTVKEGDVQRARALP